MHFDTLSTSLFGRLFAVFHGLIYIYAITPLMQIQASSVTPYQPSNVIDAGRSNDIRDAQHLHHHRQRAQASPHLHLRAITSSISSPNPSTIASLAVSALPSNSSTPANPDPPSTSGSCTSVSGQNISDIESCYSKPASSYYSNMASAMLINGILSLGSLIPSLSQSLTNGDSPLGTLSSPTLNPFLPSTSGSDNVPWGSATVTNTDPYTTDFQTGNTRYWNFNISRAYIAPDGVNKSSLLINGQFPGPTIEANWGDSINVKVCNNLDTEGTSLHWHGILQKKTPWFDGVPSVQQCPIAPGKCYDYNFVADLYGTSWYHSHYSAQYAGGLFGPMIIHGPQNVPYDIDLGPVMLNDWYHTDYYDIVENLMVTPAPPPISSDNNLINGKMNYNCSLVTNGASCTPNAGLAKFRFQSGKKHRLRLINAGAEGLQRFTIDGHNMTVMANDFVPIQPYTTNVVTLGIGQRSDVIVEATGSPNSSFWMRADISSACSLSFQPNALAAIYYEKANDTAVPTTTATIYDGSHCGNDPLSETTPFHPFPATASPATTQNIIITYEANSSGYSLWNMNGQTFRANYNHPVLLLANQGNLSYPYDPEWNVYDFGSNASVRLVVQNTVPVAHPMHLHGHNFKVLAEGVGTWNGTITNQQNTQRRDVQILQPGTPAMPGYIVVQYETDNPGVWPFHCHIAWHVSQGLYINTLERPKKIQKLDIPSFSAQTCQDWAAFTGQNVVDEIDSGLKLRDFRPSS